MGDPTKLTKAGAAYLSELIENYVDTRVNQALDGCGDPSMAAKLEDEAAQALNGFIRSITKED